MVSWVTLDTVLSLLNLFAFFFFFNLETEKNTQPLLLLRGLETTGGVPGTNIVVLGEQIR